MSISISYIQNTMGTITFNEKQLHRLGWVDDKKIQSSQSRLLTSNLGEESWFIWATNIPDLFSTYTRKMKMKLNIPNSHLAWKSEKGKVIMCPWLIFLETWKRIKIQEPKVTFADNLSWFKTSHHLDCILAWIIVLMPYYVNWNFEIDAEMYH